VGWGNGQKVKLMGWGKDSFRRQQSKH